MASFTDSFATDPSSRWTHLWNSFTWSSGDQHVATGGSGGSYSIYNTATGSATQYARVQLKDSTANGGVVLRSTGTASDGFYVVAVWDDTAYFQRGDNTGYLGDMTSTAFATAQNNSMGVTISGTGTGTTVRLWLNPANASPVDASNWDSASDPADASMVASGGTYYDTGQYVGLGVDSSSLLHDDFGGGSIGGAAAALEASISATAAAVAALTTAITLSASISAAATGAATVSTGAALAASIVVSATGAADLTTAAGLAAGISAAATGTATLSTTIALAGSLTATGTGAASLTAGIYPLAVHASGRYLVDARGQPHLLLSDSPQGMLVAASTTDMATYFAARAAQGFNASQVHVIAGTTFGGGSNTDYETYDDITPFTTQGDITTPRETYFARLDTLVETAASEGICVFLSVADMIDAHDLWKNNGTSDCTTYGAYLGNRYKDYPNVAWIVGNDFQDWTTDQDSVDALVAILDGIQSADQNHTIYTAWLDYFVSASRDSTDFDAEITLDFGYTYYIAYDKIGEEYALSPTKPVFLGETYYENDTILGLTGTPQLIRRQNYWALLAGACGITYHSDNWDFHTGWQDDLNLTGATEIAHLKTLFEAYGWHLLTPDTTNTVLTAGYGTKADGTVQPDDNVYANCAIASDASFAFAYLPDSREVTIDLSEFASAGDYVRARWFNPTSGAYTAISTYAASGTQTFTPSAGDWVLVLDVVEAANLDTYAKRASVIGLDRLWDVVLPVADGEIDGFDRRQLLGKYAGYGAAEGAALEASVSSSATGTTTLSTAITPAASISGTATGTATLTTALPLAASISTTATGTADLTSGLTVAASVSGMATGTATLTTALPLAASFTATATGASTLSTAIPLATSVEVVATGTTDLTTPGQAAALAAAPEAVATGTADLTTALRMAASVAGTATGDATLSTVIPLAASITTSATDTAALSTAVTAAASISAVATGTTELTVPGQAAALAASVSGAATGTADLSTAIPLAGSLSSAATGTTALSSAVTLASALEAAATGTADLTTAPRLAAAAAGVATGTADLSTELPLAASVSGVASGTTTLGTAIRPASAVSVTATGTADLTTPGQAADLAASISATATGTTALSTGVALASAIEGTATGTAGPLMVTGPIAASVSGTATGTATLTMSGATVAASVTGTATGTAALSTAVRFAGSLTAVATGDALLRAGLGAECEASVEVVAAGTTTLTTGLALAAAVTGTATGVADLTTAIDLAAGVEVVATGTTSLSRRATEATVEGRTWFVPAEDRAWTVPADDRTWGPVA